MANTNNVYHIIQIHSDDYHIIGYKNTKSDCPVNAIKELVNMWKAGNQFITFNEIPAVKSYMKRNSIESVDAWEELSDVHAAKIENIILSGCDTEDNALGLIDLFHENAKPRDHDPVFFKLDYESDTLMTYIGHMAKVNGC